MTAAADLEPFTITEDSNHAIDWLGGYVIVAGSEGVSANFRNGEASGALLYVLDAAAGQTISQFFGGGGPHRIRATDGVYVQVLSGDIDRGVLYRSH
jgi:hypothetical protein